MNRRTAIKLSLGAATVSTAASVVGWWRVGALAAGRRHPAADAGAYFQVVAHPDDDLYFINPEVARALQAGRPLTTVYLMAGEADGKNAPDAATAAQTSVDYPGYVAARFEGIRRAYALMGTGDYRSAWKREAVTVAGRTVELATLEAHPRVRMVLCGVRAVPRGDGPGRWLRTLWEADPSTTPTMFPVDSPVKGSQDWTRDDVLNVLVELMEQSGATVVRTLDPDPEHSSYSGGVADYTDHRDHTAAAYFGLTAARQYAGRAGRPVVFESFRGYSNKNWPRNLSSTVFAAKKRFLDAYGGQSLPCDKPYGCGDLKVGNSSASRGYGQSTVTRYPGTPSWLIQDGQQRLTAFSLLGSSLAVMREAPGATNWSRVQSLAGADLLPHLTVVLDGQGRLNVFAARRILDARQDRHRLEIVTAVQGGDGAFSAWTSLGNPADGSPGIAVQQLEMGMPVAAAAADGTVVLVVRNFGRGLSARVRAPGKDWTDWHDIRGSTLQEGVCLGRDPQGRIEVFASSDKRIFRWGLNGSTFGTPQAICDQPAASPLAIVTEPGGREVLVYREQRTGHLLLLREGESGWQQQKATTIGGNGGTGPIALAPWRGSTVVVARDDSGSCSLSAQPVGKGTSNHWHASRGPVFTGAPAVVTDAKGDLVVAAIGTDAKLWVGRATGSSVNKIAWSVGDPA